MIVHGGLRHPKTPRQRLTYHELSTFDVPEEKLRGCQLVLDRHYGLEGLELVLQPALFTLATMRRSDSEDRRRKMC